MTNAFAYVRVSTGEQAKGFSLEAQFAEIEKYSMKRGFKILERFSDSMSGTKLTERDGMMTMIDKIDELLPQYVIATETDRISRNTLQYGWIDTHLSMKGVKLLLVNETQTNDPAGKAFQKIRVIFSEFENDLRQWRIKRGRALALAEKRFMNRPPFGYVVRGKEIHVEKQKMKVVKEIFDRYCDNTPVKQIARLFNKAPSNIRYILSNQFYIYPELNGRHKVLINAEKFQRAQERLKKSRTNYQNT
ncbi:MAG: recombinase family protein [Candidatus Latescibacteria bacterium]|jgi:site-specific DNA recombinase|nr:recombinase family protein [Candidatus Latescibacterota bacterium]